MNIPFYPAGVARVAAVEPADLGWKLAGERLSETRVAVQRAGLDGQSLPFPDDSFDAALSTWTLCTIPDVAAVELLTGAGFTVTELDIFYEDSSPKFVGAISLGLAA